MKKLLLATLCFLLCFSLAFSAAANVFTKDDKVTRKYKKDEDDEFVFSSKDFNKSNLAQTAFVYISDQYFWEENGAYLESVEYEDSDFDFDMVIPEESYAPTAKSAYYLSLISGICDWLCEDKLFKKWNMLSFYINGTDTVVWLTKSNFEDVGGWMAVDTSEIMRQINR